MKTRWIAILIMIVMIINSLCVIGEDIQNIDGNEGINNISENENDKDIVEVNNVEEGKKNEKGNTEEEESHHDSLNELMTDEGEEDNNSHSESEGSRVDTEDPMEEEPAADMKDNNEDDINEEGEETEENEKQYEDYPIGEKTSESNGEKEGNDGKSEEENVETEAGNNNAVENTTNADIETIDTEETEIEAVYGLTEESTDSIALIADEGEAERKEGFQSGYAEIDENTKVYPNAESRKYTQKLGRGIVYALERTGFNDAYDRFRIAYATEYEVSIGYVSASALHPLNEIEIDEYIDTKEEKLNGNIAVLYNGDILLEVIKTENDENAETTEANRDNTGETILIESADTNNIESATPEWNETEDTVNANEENLYTEAQYPIVGEEKNTNDSQDTITAAEEEKDIEVTAETIQITEESKDSVMCESNDATVVEPTYDTEEITSILVDENEERKNGSTEEDEENEEKKGESIDKSDEKQGETKADNEEEKGESIDRSAEKRDEAIEENEKIPGESIDENEEKKGETAEDKEGKQGESTAENEDVIGTVEENHGIEGVDCSAMAETMETLEIEAASEKIDDAAYEIEMENALGVIGKKEGHRVELPGVRSQLGIGERMVLAPKEYDAGNQIVETKFTYAANDPKVAQVTQAGEVVAIAEGVAAITVKSEDGESCVLLLTVMKAPTAVILNGGAAFAGVNQTFRMIAEFPEGCAGAVSWSSGNAEIATVDENGNVTAHALGSAIIQARAYNGVIGECVLTVVGEPTGIALDKTALVLNEFDTAILSPVFEGNTFGSVAYSVEAGDDEIELVELGDSRVRVRARYSGEATVIATVQNRQQNKSYSAKCKVTVNPSVAGIELEGARETLGVGETLSLNPVAHDARGKRISTSFKVSASKSYITVSKNAQIKGARKGTATVTVSAENGLSVSQEITVKAAPKGISLDVTEARISVGEALRLVASLTEDSASAIKWTSANPKVAAVDGNGNVTAVGAGSTQITAETFNGRKAVCALTVTQAPSSLSFTQATYSVVEGMKALTALNPEVDAVYSVSDGEPDFEVAVVDPKTGVVTGLCSGEAVVTAVAHNYVTGKDAVATAKIVVTPGPARIDINGITGSLGVGEAFDLSPKAFDRNGNAMKTAFTVSVSSTSVVKADGTTIRGVRAGKATIGVTAANGCYTSMEITVARAPSRIRLDKTELTLAVGDAYAFTADISKGYGGTITWQSDNGCVSVSPLGVVTAVSPGTAKVKATTFNGKTAECTVTVFGSPAGIRFEKESYTLSEGQSEVISALVTPENFSGEVTYSIVSDNAAYPAATVDARTGRVTARFAGTAILSATVRDGSARHTASTALTVLAAPVEIELKNERTTIGLKETVNLRPVAYDARGQMIQTAFTLTSSKPCVTTNGTDSVYGAREGTAIVTVTAANGFSKSISVKTVSAPTKVSFAADALTVAANAVASVTPVLSSRQAGGFTWESENNAIAVVDENGSIRGVSAGETRVKATAYNGLSATIRVTVVESPATAAFDAGAYTVASGESVRTALVSGTDGERLNAVYSISDDDPEYVIATVDPKTGVVKGLVSGSATLRAAVPGTSLSAQTTVTVTAAPVRIEIGAERTTIGVKETVDLKPVAYDARGNAMNTSFTLKSSKSYYAAINGTSVTGKSAGSFQITVSAPNGVSAVVPIKIAKAPTSVTISRESLELSAGQRFRLSADVSGGAAGKIAWASEDASVLTVDQNGVVTAVGAGSTRVQALAYNGKADYCKVTVYAAPSGMAFDKGEYAVSVGVSFTPGLKAELLNVRYSSEDPSVARVNPITGEVRGLRIGKTNIVATARNSLTGEDVSCESRVNVVAPPVRIDIQNARSLIGVKESFSLNLKAYDAKGSEMAASFVVSTASERIASVTGNQVTGLRAGKTVVTVTANGGVRASFELEVRKAPSSLKLEASKTQLTVGETVSLKAVLSGGSAGGVTWVSENGSVVVDANGVAKAVAPGTARVKATTFNGRSAYAVLTVSAAPTSVRFERDTYIVSEGQTVETVVSAQPVGSRAEVEYAISDEDPRYVVATVDRNGRVRGLHTGIATLVATAHNFETGADYKTFTVVAVTPAAVRVALLETRTTIGQKESIDLRPVAYDANGDVVDTRFTVKSSKSYCVAVDGTRITGKSSGSSVVTVTAENGISHSVTVKVLRAPSALLLEPEAAVVSETGTVQMSAGFPDGQTGSVVWKSSDPGVATVDANGRVSAVKRGSCAITATSYNGKTASCTLNVLKEPEGLSFEKSRVSIGEGAKLAVTARHVPGCAGRITYASLNTSIAKVDAATGLVTALRQGVTTVIASTVNGITGKAYSARYELTVSPAPVLVEFRTDRNSLGQKESLDVSAVAYDANGNVVGCDFTYTSSSRCIKVSGSEIQGASTGSATVTAVAYNGVKVSRKFTVTRAPSRITVSPASVTTSIGNDPVRLTADLPSKAASEIVWKSEDESIATVDANGNVTGVAYGSVRVQATTYNGKSAYCTVNVFYAPERVTLDRHNLTLGKDASVRLNAVLSEKAAGAVRFQSSNPAVAAVTDDGCVTAVGIGQAKITVTTYNGKTDVCLVEVKPAPTYMNLSVKRISIGVNQKIDMDPFIQMPEGTVASITYKSESSRYVSVSEDGVIQGLKVGSTRVRATAHNGLRVILEVKVLKAASSVALSFEKPYVYLGETVKAVVELGSASMASWTLSTSNPAVCAVEADGATLRGVALGTAVVTVTTHTGVCATASIEVVEHVKGIALESAERTLEHYDEVTLKASVIPENAYDRSVTWTSSNPDVVSVDENGKITALKISSTPVTITAKTNDQSFTAACAITVTPKRATGVQMSDADVALEQKKTFALTATVLPENADNCAVTWRSSDPSVATVNENGVVTAVSSEGVARIIATSVDGGFTAECVVTALHIRAMGIALNSTEFDMLNCDTFQLVAEMQPIGAEAKSMEWRSSDESVVTVSGDGLVTAHRAGSAVVTVTATDYEGRTHQAACEFSIAPVRATGVRLSKELMGLRVGASDTLTATVEPDAANDKSVRWKSSDASIASVTSSGECSAAIRGLKAGSVTITATTTDGGLTASCRVNVSEQLAVEIVSNFAYNTVGNDIVWEIECGSAVGEPKYAVRVKKDGAPFDGFTRNGNIVTVPQAALGTYEIDVTVEDETRETASANGRVIVSDMQTYTEDGLTYAYRIATSLGVQGAAVTLVTRDTTKTTIRVPATMNGIKVVRIDTEAFAGMSGLKVLSIPSTVNTIGARAFKGCPMLTDVESYKVK